MDCTKTASANHKDGGEKEFTEALKTANISFLKACEAQIHQSAHCILVPSIKEYLIQVKDALAKLDLESGHLDTDSLVQIGAVMKSLQCGLVPEEQEQEVAEEGLKIYKSSNETKPGPSSKVELTTSDVATNCKESVVSDVIKVVVDQNQTSVVPEKEEREVAVDEAGGSQHESLSNESYPGPSPKHDLADTSDTAAADKETDVVKVEEKDTLYNVRCKLYVLSGKRYKPKGVGIFYVRLLLDGKHEVIVLEEGAGGKLLLQARIIPTLPIVRASYRDIILLFDKEDHTSEIYLIRLADESICSDLHHFLSALTESYFL